jgi:hypothetical protein
MLIYIFLWDAMRNILLLSDGEISIESKKINAIAADYSAPSVKNPITVDEEGIKFDSLLDCGYFDSI